MREFRQKISDATYTNIFTTFLRLLMRQILLDCHLDPLLTLLFYFPIITRHINNFFLKKFMCLLTLKDQNCKNKQLYYIFPKLIINSCNRENLINYSA